MSRKYISQVDENNFVYPNNTNYEYDTEIIHNINSNSVTGSVTNLTAVLVSGTSITFTLVYNWVKNGAEVYILPDGKLSLVSVHMMAAGQDYYKPWRMVHNTSNSTTTIDSFSGTTSFTVTASQMGLTSFSNGTYYFDVRFIGLKSVYNVCASVSVNAATPTPTPTPSPTQSSGAPVNTPTATPTPTSTQGLTPTPTPSSTPLTPTYSFKLGYSADSPVSACNDYNPSTSDTFWSYCSSLANSCYLYTVGDYPLSGTPPDGYYSNGTYEWYVVGGYMVSQTLCSFTPTPTPTPTQLGEGFGINTGTTYTTSTAACAAATYPNITIYLTAGDTNPTVGDYFYKDQYTTPGNTFVGNSNYYCVRKGGTLWAIQIGSSGQITAVTTC